jgi:hypothetical protein
MRRDATKDTANRYVTWLIDVLFKPEELVAISPQHLQEDDRYVMMLHLLPLNFAYYLAINVSDAVRNKFQLPPDEMERIWPWLHTVTLAKRRTLDGKTKKQNDKTLDNV